MEMVLVDDNENALQIIGKMLYNFGWHYDTAMNGDEALKLVEHNPCYDIVFIDWKMPYMDGFSVSKQIKAMLKEHAPIIIMITAYGYEVISQQLTENSNVLDGFLVKPITSSMLFDAVVDAMLCHSMLQRENIALAHTPIASLKNIRILLVEDNKTNQFIACELLKSQGAQVHTADSGIEAITLLEKNPRAFNVILMDIQMPDMDGYAVTQDIRERLKLKKLPIIAMTANILDSDRVKAFEAGMNEYVPKPINQNTLVNAILRATNRPIEKSDEQSNNQITTQEITSYLMTSAALDRLNGNKSIYENTLTLFIKDAPMMVTQITQYSAQHDYEHMRNTLHALKGVAASVGAMQVANLAAALEQKNSNEVNATMAHLDTVLQQTVHEAQAILSTQCLNNSNHQQQSKEQWLQELRRLINLLKGSNMKAIDLSEQMKQQCPEVFSERCREICDFINRLAFKEAVALCLQLLETNG